MTGKKETIKDFKDEIGNCIVTSLSDDGEIIIWAYEGWDK
jgi:hypothetical protein